MVGAFATETIPEINLYDLLLGVGKVFEGLDFFFFTGSGDGLGEEGESGSGLPFV